MSYARGYVIKNLASVTFDGVEVKNQLTRARLVPDTPTQTLRTFGGVDKDRDSTSWVFEMSGHQDRGTGGIAKLLETAITANDTITVILTPKSGTGQDVATFDFLPVPVEFGGEVGAWKLFEGEFEVIDSPAFTQSA